MTVTNEGRKEKDVEESAENGNSFVLRVISLSLIVITPSLASGMTVAFPSIALPQLKLNLDDASWFGSMMSITRPLGSLFIGLVIDKYGRRISMICSILPHIVGWFLLVDQNASLVQLYAGRLLTGFALGAAGLPSIIYAAECITVNHSRIRSSIGTWTMFAMATGCMFVYGFGTILPYNQVAFIAGVLSALSLLLILIFIPESPTWLYQRGRVGDAEMAQQRLGIKQPILRKLDTTRTHSNGHNTNHVETADEKYLKMNLKRYLAQISRREVYKPLAITITFLFFSEFSGIYCLVTYMVDVITVYPLNADPYVLSFVCGLLQIVGCLMLTFMLPCCGVKKLSMGSFLGVGTGFVVLAFSVLFENSSSPNVFNYFHFLSIWVIMVVANLGLFAIPFAVLGEMFPVEAKGFASLALFSASIFNFIILKIFPYLFAQHRDVVYIAFSLVCVCGCVFVKIFLPETVGKTMEEVRSRFKQSKANGNSVSSTVNITQSCP